MWKNGFNYFKMAERNSGPGDRKWYCGGRQAVVGLEGQSVPRWSVSLAPLRRSCH